MSIEIIDDFLTPTYANVVEETLQAPQQPWSFLKNSSVENEKNQECILNYGFNFLIYSKLNPSERGWSESPITMLLRPFLYQVQDTICRTRLLRCRVDMTVASSVPVLHSPHVDVLGNHITTIYYVSDSDGDTVVYNEREKSNQYSVMKTISPKKNRLVIFDGEHYHTGHSPMKHKNRILINSNFI